MGTQSQRGFIGQFVGEIRNGRHIGYPSSNRYIWWPCERCHRERWVQLKNGEPRSKRCKYCVLKDAQRPKGIQSHNWKGGICRNGPYRMVICYPDSPFFSMARRANSDSSTYYIQEHRLVMAKHLGRCLDKSEMVHHCNGIKTDNRIENLYLTTKAKHKLGFGDAYSDGYDEGYKQGYQDARARRFANVVKQVL